MSRAPIALKRTLWLALALWISIARATEPADVVIIGGGPVGLATAIEARKAGAERVIVLEKRGLDRKRANMLAITRGTLHNLAHLGVVLKDGDNISFVRSSEKHEPNGNVTRRRYRAPKIEPTKATHRVGDMLKKTGPMGGLIAINRLEADLLAAAHATGGIEVRFESEVTDVETHAAGATARVKNARGAEESVTAKYLVIADGARSPMRDKLGVKVKDRGKSTRIVGGVFTDTGGAHVIKHQIPNHTPGATHTTIMRLGHAKQSGVLAEVPPGLVLDDPGALERFYRDAAKQVGVTGDLVIGPSEFRTVLTRAERFSVGKHVFILGDAARTTHVFSGLGVNWGLRDAARFGRLYQRLSNAKDPDARLALAWWNRETSKATTRLHTRALPQFDNLVEP